MSNFSILVNSAARENPSLGRYMPMILAAASNEDDFQNGVLCTLEILNAPYTGDQPESVRVAYALREAISGRRLARQDEKYPVLPTSLRDDAVNGVENFSDLTGEDDDYALDAVLSLVSDEMFTVDEAVTALSHPTDSLLRRLHAKGLCARSTCGWAYLIYQRFLAETVVFVEQGNTAGDCDEAEILAYANRQAAGRKAERKAEMERLGVGYSPFFADPADEPNDIESAWNWERQDKSDDAGLPVHPTQDFASWPTLEMTFARAYKVVETRDEWDAAHGWRTTQDVQWVQGDEYGPSADVSDTEEIDRMAAEIRGLPYDRMLDVDLEAELPQFEKPAPQVQVRQWEWMARQLTRPLSSGYWHNPRFQSAKARAVLQGFNGDYANAIAFAQAYRTGREKKVLTCAELVCAEGIATRDGRLIMWAQAAKQWDLIVAPDMRKVVERIRAVTTNKDALTLADRIEHIRLAVH